MATIKDIIVVTNRALIDCKIFIKWLRLKQKEVDTVSYRSGPMDLIRLSTLQSLIYH